MEFINLKKQYEVLKESIDERIFDVIKNAEFIGGKYVEQFEKEMASYIGRKHCITCGNGTDALQLAYMAYGIGTGDAVFCPDMTFIASIEPAVLLGATPVFCDIDLESYNMSVEDLEKKILMTIKEGVLNPKAVVAVDFLGNPADHDRIYDLCKKHNLVMIEDGAQSTGGAYKGKKCGSFGDIATTSFFPSKPLGCYGDGGAIFTDDDEIAELIRSYKVHGKGPKGKYHNVRIGMNSRLDNIQAAVLLPKLSVLDDEIAMRQKIAARYDEGLKDYVIIPKVDEANISAYAQYCILTKDSRQRELLKEELQEKGIPSLIYYPTQLHSLEAFSCNKIEEIECAKNYAECNLGLPFSPYLSQEEQDLVISTIVGFIDNYENKK